MLGQRSANLGIGRGAHVVDQLDGLIEFGLRYLSEILCPSGRNAAGNR